MCVYIKLLNVTPKKNIKLLNYAHLLLLSDV
jgi:hypothetical protein